MVVAAIALFVALGSSGYAAVTLVRSSADAAASVSRAGAARPLTKAEIIALIRRYAPGSIVLTRVRSTGPTVSASATISLMSLCHGLCPDSAHGAPVGLTGGAWTQTTHQLNEFVGQISVTPPNSSSCTYYDTLFGATLPGVMEGEIEDAVTGARLATFSGAASSTPAAMTVPLTVTALFEPGRRVKHALIVKLADNCGAGGNGAVGGGHFTLGSFALDPVGVS
jgi:hypothetical protein